MRARFIDKLAVILFACFLAGPAAMACLAEPLHLPGWLSGRSGAELAGHHAGAIGEPGIDDILSGRFQDAVDEEMAGHLPCKVVAQLGYAGVQRNMIRVAAAPFGYAVAPCYYGAGKVIDYEHGWLGALPWTWGQHFAELEKSLGFLQGIVDRHPGIDWYFCLVECDGVSELNFANSLVSRRISYPEMLERARKTLTGVRVIDGHVSSAEDYGTDFFHSDHHMQVQGAVKLYRRIIGALGRKPVEVEGYREVAGVPGGSYARDGLCLEFPDTLYEVVYDRADVTVSFDGEEVAWSEAYPASSPTPPAPVHRYAGGYSWGFHGDEHTIEFENRSLPDEAGSLLLLGDSMDNSTDRLYAESYRHVYELDARNDALDEIEAFIDAHPDIRDAVVMGTSGTFASDSGFGRADGHA